MLFLISNFNNDDNFERIADFANSENFNIDNKINLLNLFKKIYLDFFEVNISNLKLIKQSFPFCTRIRIECLSSKEFETLTNPILYQNGVQLFEFTNYRNCIYLSNNIISNIKEINPKSVCFKGKVLYKWKLNFIDILSGLPNKMKITFEKSNSYDPISLWFSNTVLKIFQTDRDEYNLFEWKLFKFKIDQNYFKSIKGEYNWTNPNSSWLALRLDNYNQVEFEDFNLISNKELADEVDLWFPPCIPDIKNKWTVFILAKDLIDAKLSSWVIYSQVYSGTAQWLLLKWSKLKLSILQLCLSSNSKCITKFIKLAPQNIELVLSIHLDKLQL